LRLAPAHFRCAIASISKFIGFNAGRRWETTRRPSQINFELPRLLRRDPSRSMAGESPSRARSHEVKRKTSETCPLSHPARSISRSKRFKGPALPGLVRNKTSRAANKSALHLRLPKFAPPPKTLGANAACQTPKAHSAKTGFPSESIFTRPAAAVPHKDSNRRTCSRTFSIRPAALFRTPPRQRRHRNRRLQRPSFRISRRNFPVMRRNSSE